jgi:hypothetical protein
MLAIALVMAAPFRKVRGLLLNDWMRRIERTVRRWNGTGPNRHFILAIAAAGSGDSRFFGAKCQSVVVIGPQGYHDGRRPPFFVINTGLRAEQNPGKRNSENPVVRFRPEQGQAGPAPRNVKPENPIKKVRRRL